AGSLMGPGGAGSLVLGARNQVSKLDLCVRAASGRKQRPTIGKRFRKQIEKVHENIREVVKAGGGKFDRDVIYIGWFSQTLNMEQSLAAAREVILNLLKALSRPLWPLKRHAL